MNESMKNVEKKVAEVENKIDPPAKDLTAAEVLRSMIDIIRLLAISIVVTIVIFISYIVYKDWQYNQTINKISSQYTEFINSFEFTSDETTLDSGDGGNAGYVGGDGTVNNGTSSSTPQTSN